MPFDEFQKWIVYFETRPPEWRDDDRAFKLLQAQGVKQKAWDVFPSLEIIYKPKVSEGLKGLKGSAIFAQMLNAKGGDRLEL
jgi:hypothetical protein